MTGDITISPSDLTSGGKTLGTLGKGLAKSGAALERSGQELVNSAKQDQSGFGAAIANAFGKGAEITGGVFKEGGGWLDRAGSHLHQNGQNHLANEEEQASRFRGIRPETGTTPTPHPGGAGGGSGGGTGGGGNRGPVHVVIPKGASADQVKQFENYAAGANRAVAANALSRTGRVASTKNGVRKAATKAAKAERDRKAAAGTPYQGVAGHVPDAAWMGQGEPFEWQDMDRAVNSSLAGQINRYPVGYRPTEFRVVYPEPGGE